MNSTLQVRLDKETKEKAQKTLNSMGLDMSSGIKLFLTQVINLQSIPFPVLSANHWSAEQKRKIIAQAKEAFKNGRGFRTAKELHKDILS
jgi:DNA-damage-inducible protein J